MTIKTISKKPIIATIAATILLGTVLIASNAFTNDVEAQPPQAGGPSNDVVIIMCPRDGGFDAPVFVIADSSSANAPTITGGLTTSCAQTLADLLDAGFVIESVNLNDFASVYTLIR